MAITGIDSLVAALASAQRMPYYKSNVPAEGSGTIHSFWKVAGQPGAGSTPPSGDGEVPTSATAGALPFTNPSGGEYSYLVQGVATGTLTGTIVLYDRLWHNSGFVGNVTTAQTITTPPTITRPDALGADVELWGEVYTAMGATASTFTATYTDQDGNASQSATYSHPANALTVGQMFRFELAAGDGGVRSVSQVQLSTSTGTAGNFGLVLLRRIAEIPIPSASAGLSLDTFSLGMPRIYDSACLALMLFCTSTNTGTWMGSFSLAQG